jgi:hypothetical protein
MASAGLLPQEWPAVLRRSRGLELATASAGSSLSRLRGRLQLTPQPEQR